MPTNSKAGSLIPITLAIPEDPRSMAIIDGTVKPEGIQLTCIHKFKSVKERLLGMMNGEYDANETGSSVFLRIKARGGNQIALPVIFLRGFRHGNIFCRKDSPINTFSDLKGKTIGGANASLTTFIWIRGMLHHEYGVPRDSVKWVVAEADVDADQQEDRSSKFKYTLLNRNREVLWEMVDKREIDAAVLPGNDGYFSLNQRQMAAERKSLGYDPYTGGDLYGEIQKRGNLRTIQGDRKTITEYYKKTGMYPISHLVTMKLDLAKRHPNVPKSLLAALRQSRELAGKYQDKEAKRQMAEEIKFLGYDPYSCRLSDADKKALNTLMEYMVEEGFLEEKLPLASLFVEDTI